MSWYCHMPYDMRYMMLRQAAKSVAPHLSLLLETPCPQRGIWALYLPGQRWGYQPSVRPWSYFFIRLQRMRMMKRGFAGVVETSTSLKSQPAPLSGKRLVTASSIQRRSIIYLFSGRFSRRGWPWDQTLWTAGWICLCFCVVLRFSTSLCAFFSWTGLRCGDCSWQEQRGGQWWRWRWRRTWPSWGRSTRAVLIWACRIGMSESTGGGNASPVHPYN